MDELTEFDKIAGAILDARSAPEGRGPGWPESIPPCRASERVDGVSIIRFDKATQAEMPWDRVPAWNRKPIQWVAMERLV